MSGLADVSGATGASGAATVGDGATDGAVGASEVVIRAVEDGVAVLTLNRPERLNAWTHAMENAYFDLLEDCARDPAVRSIVVTGAGRGFCAGADMDDLQALGNAGAHAHDGAQAHDGTQAHDDAQADAGARADDGAQADGGTPEVAKASEGDGHGAAASAACEGATTGVIRARRPQSLPLSIPKPIIAAINGPCAGIGLVQALMCDIRFAADGAKLTTAFARRGLVAEHGISWVLPRLIGPARALDLLLSGRVLLAGEAAELGLVNHCLPADELLGAALTYARELSSKCSPTSMATMKAQVYADLEHSLDEAIARADRLMLASFGRPDFVEGVASFVERRDPSFAPLFAD